MFWKKKKPKAWQSRLVDDIERWLTEPASYIDKLTEGIYLSACVLGVVRSTAEAQPFHGLPVVDPDYLPARERPDQAA